MKWIEPVGRPGEQEWGGVEGATAVVVGMKMVGVIFEDTRTLAPDRFVKVVSIDSKREGPSEPFRVRIRVQQMRAFDSDSPIDWRSVYGVRPMPRGMVE